MNNSSHQAKSPTAIGLNAKENSAQWGECTPVKDQTRLGCLRARAAQAGVTLFVYADNDTGPTIFVMSRWSHIRQLESLTAAEAWLDMVLGAKK